MLAQPCSLDVSTPQLTTQFDSMTPLETLSPTISPLKLGGCDDLAQQREAAILAMSQKPEIMQLHNYHSRTTFDAMLKTADQIETPCVVIDLDTIEQSYDLLKNTFPYGTIYFAVKANPDIEITKALVNKGCSFDIASRYELDKVLSAGLPPSRASFGNTIKKARDIKYFYDAGVRLFATDSLGDLQNIAKYAPGSSVYCRIKLDYGEATSEWPLSHKFGCSSDMAYDLLVQAKELGLTPAGVSFHPGSQQKDVLTWPYAINIVATMYKKLYDEHGIKCALVNLGGGLCANYVVAPDTLVEYERVISNALDQFEPHIRPETIIFEPGRSLVGNAGMLVSEVVMVSQKDINDTKKWVYIDCGIFGGVIEALGESIKYPMLLQKQEQSDATALCSYIPEQEIFDQLVCTEEGRASELTEAQVSLRTEPRIPVILAGPTCDSADIIYQNAQYRLPHTVAQGDRIILLSTGAYTTSYSAVEFNGFPPLKSHIMRASAFKQ